MGHVQSNAVDDQIHLDNILLWAEMKNTINNSVYFSFRDHQTEFKMNLFYNTVDQERTVEDRALLKENGSRHLTFIILYFSY